MPQISGPVITHINDQLQPSTFKPIEKQNMPETHQNYHDKNRKSRKKNSWHRFRSWCVIFLTLFVWLFLFFTFGILSTSSMVECEQEFTNSNIDINSSSSSTLSLTPNSTIVYTLSASLYSKTTCSILNEPLGSSGLPECLIRMWKNSDDGVVCGNTSMISSICILMIGFASFFQLIRSIQQKWSGLHYRLNVIVNRIVSLFSLVCILFYILLVLYWRLSCVDTLENEIDQLKQREFNPIINATTITTIRCNMTGYYFIIQSLAIVSFISVIIFIRCRNQSNH